MEHAREPGHDFTSQYYHLEGPAAIPIAGTGEFWNVLMSGNPTTGDAARVARGGGWLISAYAMERDTTTWELHPAGDELLFLVSGLFDVVIDEGGTEPVVELRTGTGCLVARGHWHRTVVRQPGQLLALTYGEGTQHRPV